MVGDLRSIFRCGVFFITRLMLSRYTAVDRSKPRESEPSRDDQFDEKVNWRRNKCAIRTHNMARRTGQRLVYSSQRTQPITALFKSKKQPDYLVEGLKLQIEQRCNKMVAKTWLRPYLLLQLSVARHRHLLESI